MLLYIVCSRIFVDLVAEVEAFWVVGVAEVVVGEESYSYAPWGEMTMVVAEVEAAEVVRNSCWAEVHYSSDYP